MRRLRIRWRSFGSYFSSSSPLEFVITISIGLSTVGILTRAHCLDSETPISEGNVNIPSQHRTNLHVVSPCSGKNDWQHGKKCLLTKSTKHYVLLQYYDNMIYTNHCARSVSHSSIAVACCRCLRRIALGTIIYSTIVFLWILCNCILSKKTYRNRPQEMRIWWIWWIRLITLHMSTKIESWKQ